jgi:mannose-6-phosphate isomerase
LERWRVAGATTWRYGFDGVRILSNAGAPVTLRGGSWRGRLERGRTLLLPAALGEVDVDGPADLLVGYLPDLARDVRAPLLAAGHGAAAIATLGEGLEEDHGDDPPVPDLGAGVG